MPYPNDYGAQSSWSAVLDGFVQLVQLASAAASAKILQDPDAQSVLKRGFVAPYAADPEIKQQSFDRFDAQLGLIRTEYDELQACFQSLHRELRLTEVQVRGMSWRDAEKMNLAHDCIAIDRFRYRITQHLAQCAILHAQAVCAVTAYLENITTAYICPPQNFGPFVLPLGTPQDTATDAHRDQAKEGEAPPADDHGQTARGRGRPSPSAT